MRCLGWAVLGIALCACGGQRQGQFPSAEELAKLAQQPVPPANDAERKVGGPWKPSGPLPEQMGDVPGTTTSPFNDLLAAAAAKQAGLVMVSEPMNCVARELGRHYAAHKAPPTDELRRFVAGACGATDAFGIGIRYHYGEVPPETKEDEVFTQWHDALQKLAEGRPGAGPQQVGGWLGIQDGMAVAMVASARREAMVTPLARAAGPDGKIRVEGELIARGEHVEAMVNQGEFGYAACDADPQVALPRFAFTCPVHADDPIAWIDVASFESGRFLGNSVVRMQAWPAGKPVEGYAPPELAGATPPDADRLRGELLDAINAVRKDAGLAPLKLADEESALAGKLVGHYWAAIDGRVEETMADKVAMGLMAGWSIPGLVRRGNFASGRIGDAPLTAQLLRDLVELPGGRSTVFDPEAQFVAIGAETDASVLSTVVGTYRIFDAAATREAAKKDADAAFAEIVKQRAARGRSAPKRLVVLEDHAQELIGKRYSKTDDTENDLNDLMNRVMSYTKLATRGWRLQVDKFAEMKLPDAVLDEEPLEVMVVVGYSYEPPDPWASRIVMLAFANHGGATAFLWP